MNGFALRPGTLNVLLVSHDDWCGFFLTGSPLSCNCVANVELIEIDDNNIEQICRRIAADNKRTEQLKRASRN